MDKIIETLKPLNRAPCGENWYTLGQLFGYGDEQLKQFQRRDPLNPIKVLLTNCDYEQLTKLDKNLRLLDADCLADKLQPKEPTVYKQHSFPISLWTT